MARHTPGPGAAPSRGRHIGSAPAYRPRGSVAERRHPRAGTGSGGYGYSHRPHYGHHRPYHGGYDRPYYGHHRPYYRGYYRPYYRPSFYASLYLGWPYCSAWPYYPAWPYDSGFYSYYTGYSTGYYAPPPVYGDNSLDPVEAPTRDTERSYEPDRDSGRLRLEVRPEDTSVYVDDEFRGTAREARILTLPPGRHTIELVRPGYVTERRDVEVVSAESRDVLVELQRP